LLDSIDLVVPTRNAMPWAFVIAPTFRKLGLRPRYFVDARSSPLFKRLAQWWLPDARRLDSTAPFVEAMYEQILAACGRKWVLRLDDDEAPSAALVDWLRTELGNTDKRVVAIARRAVLLRDGAAYYAAAIPNIQACDYQYRLFLRDGVRLRPEIHTPAIHFDANDVLYAPQECCIYHLDWVVRTHAERAAKLDFYAAILPGAGQVFLAQYLPEDVGSNALGLVPLADTDILRVALKLRTAGRIVRALKWVRQLATRQRHG
jgi:hypothetical protein